MVNFKVSRPKIFDENTDWSRYETAKVYGSNDEESLGSNIVVGGTNNSDDESEHDVEEGVTIASSMPVPANISFDLIHDTDYDADHEADHDEETGPVEEASGSERPRKRIKIGVKAGNYAATTGSTPASAGLAPPQASKRKITKTVIPDSESELTELEGASPSPPRRQRRATPDPRQAGAGPKDSHAAPRVPRSSPGQTADPNDADDDDDSSGVSSPPRSPLPPPPPRIPQVGPTRIPAAPVECTCTTWCTCTSHAWRTAGNLPTPMHLGEWALVDMARSDPVSSVREERLPTKAAKRT